MSDRRLVKQYSGAQAETYDDTRIATKRFEEEERAFARLYELASPRSVLDCPVGTGRWVAFYAEKGARALGLDASEDMLAKAREKVPEGADVRLEVADLFDADRFRSLDRSFDLVVCVRFLNWVAPEKLEAVLRNLDAAAGRHVLIGVGVFPGAPGSLERLRAKWALARINLARRIRGRWPQHVHDAGGVESVARSLGWREVAREQIFAGKGRVSWFLLFERGA